MITKVEIVFENCDSLELENKDIYNMSVDGIIESASASNLFQHHTSFEEAHKSYKLFYHRNWDDSHFRIIKTPKSTHISVYKDALISKRTSFGDGALERLKFGDITQLHVYTKEPKRTFTVPKPFRQFFYTWSIPLAWKKESLSLYPIYEEKEDKLGAPNIYQTVIEKAIQNFYKDDVVEIAIVEDLEKKRENKKRKAGLKSQKEASTGVEASCNA